MPGSELGRAWNGQRRKNDIQRSTILARQELLKLQAERPTDPPPQPAEPEAIYYPIGFVPESVGQALSPGALACAGPPGPALRTFHSTYRGTIHPHEPWLRSATRPPNLIPFASQRAPVSGPLIPPLAGMWRIPTKESKMS